ncbi:hypothetical protein SAMN04487915_106147 [Arthrobacter sp. ov118]|nr:hypothetical protein SAMN04487915_106147 [Arthrobacter sp. ov118]
MAGLKSTASGVKNILGGVGIDSALAREILEEMTHALPIVSATRHPLGFAHLELTNIVGGSFRTRLHLWTKETAAWADDLGSLHDHTWDLRSAVLTGGLTDIYLEPRQDPSGPFGAYQIEYGNDGNTTVQLDGRWSLDEREVRTVRQGDIYELRPRAVHCTTVERFPTATLVIAKDIGGPGPKVFLPGAAGEMPAGERAELDPDWMLMALRQAVESLSGRAGDRP